MRRLGQGFTISTAGLALAFLGVLFGACKGKGIGLADGAVDPRQGNASTSTGTGSFSSVGTVANTWDATSTVSDAGGMTAPTRRTSTGQDTVTVPNTTSTGIAAATNATSTGTAATKNATATATSTASASASSPTALPTSTGTGLGTGLLPGNAPARVDASARDTMVPIDRPPGPCDIYADAKTPCVAAYSIMRVLSKTYSGPLFQLKMPPPNASSGSRTTDIMPGPDGFVRAGLVDNVRGKATSTISVLYDQSGNGNHLMSAPKGSAAAGETAAEDDYESKPGKGSVTTGGQGGSSFAQRVYSLVMDKHEGYRLQAGVVGKNVPTGTQPQGLYMLADGTRDATACCWEFGNVTSKPETDLAFVDALFLGIPSLNGRGDGAGPWFLADFGGGRWAGGSKPGAPGSPGLESSPPNPRNPSLKVPFALGFLKVRSQSYAIRVAALSTDNEPVTAFEGTMPLAVDHQGGIVLGVGSNNENASWGTFYEGAIVAGYPDDDVEVSVMKNIQALGYAK